MLGGKTICDVLEEKAVLVLCLALGPTSVAIFSFHTYTTGF